jgi:hypothetical protein
MYLSTRMERGSEYSTVRAALSRRAATKAPQVRRELLAPPGLLRQVILVPRDILELPEQRARQVQRERQLQGTPELQVIPAHRVQKV